MKLINVCTNCQVVTDTQNNIETVFSYGTAVLSWHGNAYHRLWSGWSATTARHINKAIGRKLTKKEWDVMPVEEY